MHGKWIWSRADVTDAKAGETVVFRKAFELKSAPVQAIAAVSCDNSYTLFLNGAKLHAGDNWEAPDAIVLTGKLKAGQNDLVIVAKNGGSGPNPAALVCEIVAHLSDKQEMIIASDESWQWTMQLPDGKGKFAKEPADLKPAVSVNTPDLWNKRIGPQLSSILTSGSQSVGRKARASLLKSDFLMRALGRPNRDQIVSLRPADLTTLEAIDLANGQSLADNLQQGSKKLMAREWKSSEEFVYWLFQSTLSREPSPTELATMKEGLGEQLSPQGIEDALWSVLMLPEFQLVR